MEVSITIAAADEISEAWGHPSIPLVTTTDGSAVCAAGLFLQQQIPETVKTW